MIVFAVTSVSFLSNLTFTQVNMTEAMKNELSLALDIADNLISANIKLLKFDASTIAERILMDGSTEAMGKIMEAQANEFVEFTSLTLYTRDGFFANYGEPVPHDSFISENDYIQRAFNGESVIYHPHYNNTDGSFIMHVFVPMGSDMVLSATFPGLYFADILSDYRLWQSGNIFMVNDAGTVVANFRRNLVYEQYNFIEEAKADPYDRVLQKTAGFFKNLISSDDSGFGKYTYDGQERFCVYKRVNESDAGWYIGIAAPLNENPANDIKMGLLWSSVVLLGVWIILSVFISRFVVKPFIRIETQNKDLERLNETVRIQTAQMQDEHERVKLLLDATPLSCRLMKRLDNGRFELFECNEESAKLFNLKNKQEYIERYFELYPEYQPDGKNSLEEGQRLFEIAYNEGGCVAKFYFQTIDGKPIPTEVTLVRVKYGNEYVVAGYTRDLREHEKMTNEIEKRDSLLNTVNSAAAVMLATEDEKEFESSLMGGMELMGKCVNADRVHIMRNEIINGELYFTYEYEWENGVGRPESSIIVEHTIAYDYISQECKEVLLRGECLNGPVSNLPETIREFFRRINIISVLVIPVFIQDYFWGLVSFSDCENERVFSDDEVNILRSGSLMMVNVLNRNEQTFKIRDAHEQTTLLLDAMPLACNLWDRNLNMFICNEEHVRLFGANDRQDFIEHFTDYSPEYQPDGSLSAEKSTDYVKKAFEDGKYYVFEWMHQTKDKTPLPCEITMVRVTYNNDYAVAVYVRDLREHKRMMTEIGKKTNLLNTMNQVANILLKSGSDDFEDNLLQCMKMIGESLKADRVCIWKNSVKENELYCTQIYEWVSDERFRTSKDISTDVPYKGNIPTWEKLLPQGQCINSLVRDLPPVERDRMAMHGVLSVFSAPVFVNGEYWGFLGCDDCNKENVFTDEEVSILYSGTLLIANALLHNEMMQNIKNTAVKLDAALKEARRANEAKSDFLANMSHEMRTPLNAIIGLSDLTLEDEELDEESYLNLEKINNAGEILLTTVNDILDISKIEAGRFEILPGEYDVPSLINDTVTQNILRTGEKPIEFILDIHNNLPARLYGDELRIKQIFNNLLSNAFKYTKEGTITLSISCDRDGDDVWMTAKIKDTGIGIRAADMNKLFASYNQVDTRANRQIEGTGLGLALTKRMAELMDGAVTAESEYGKGSVFTVRLRQKYVTDATIGQEVVENLKNFRYSEQKRRSNSKITRISLPYASVLVVDDNVTNLDVAKGLMKPYNMRVDCVTGGQQAIDAVLEEKVRYNAIFMDHMMPDMDGVEATRIIREIDTDYAKNIPIIACTANAISGSEEMFLSKGFQAFLSKPIEIVRLDNIIRRFVRDKSLEEKLGLDTDTENINLSINNDNEISVNDSKWHIDGIDIKKGLDRFSGDGGSFLKVLRSYADNTSVLLEKIRDVDKDGLADYAITVHGIKGSSFGVCAEIIGAEAESLEKAAKENNMDYVTENNAVFIEHASRLVENIRDMLEKTSPEKPKPKKDKPDPEVLSKLLDACGSYDMDGVDGAMAEIEAYDYESDGGLALWLRENVNKLEFKDIIEKLTKLLTEK